MKYQQGQLQAAETLLLDARVIYTATVGLEHPETKSLQRWIDEVQEALNRR